MKRLLSGSVKEGRIDLLLEAAALAAARDLPAKPLVDTWSRAKNKLASASSICELFAFLQKYQWPPPPQRSLAEGDVAKSIEIANPKKDAAVKAYAEAVVASTQRHSSIRTKEKDRYFEFTPAWVLEDRLESWFGELDPGRVIAEYMRIMYPRAYAPQPELHYWGEGLPAIPVGLFKALTKICFDAIRITPDLTKAQRTQYHSTAKLLFEGSSSNGEFAALLKGLPQPMFTALLRIHDGKNFSIDAEAKSIQPYVSWALGCCWSRSSGVHVPDKYCRVILELLNATFDAHSKTELPDLSDALTEAIKRFENELEQRTPAQAPIDLGECWSIRFLAHTHGYKEDQETLHTALMLSDVYILPDDNDYALYPYGERDWPFGDRTSNYIKLISRARSNGLIELADSLVSFYLFSQCLVEFKFADWRSIEAFVSRALEGSSAATVQKALSFAYEIARHRDDKLLARTLFQYLGPTPEAEGDRDPGNVVSMRYMLRNTRNEAALELERYLGSESWSRLSESTRGLLVDADLKWMNAFVDLAKVEQSWGEMAVAYAKPFESELSQRLEPVLSSPEGINYCVAEPGRSVAASLGQLVHLLYDFPNLSLTMREAISATGVQLQGDLKLIGQLRTLVRFRNRGAHASHPFRASDLVELKSLLFEGGLLKGFAQNLAF